MIAILCALLVVLVHGCAATGSDRTQPIWMASVLRRDMKTFAPGDTAGKFIKVLPAASSSQVRNITAAGTSTSKFFLERSNAKNAYAIRYREGKNDYYLCVESAGKLVLRKSNIFPSQNKYFFEIRGILVERRLYHYYKSMETGEYLHADCIGNVFMAAVPSSSLTKGKPQVKGTWFLMFGVVS